MPVYSTNKHKDGSIIAIWEITETEDALLQIGSLPSNEQEEMAFITNEQRRKERLVVHLLLTHLFGKKIYLGYHDNGRPFLQNATGDISIAHTRRFACIIYHPTAHVGIDIESATRNFAAVEQKILSGNEKKSLSAKHRDRQLCLIWCAKEALYKHICDPGIDFAAQLDVAKFTPRKKGKLAASYTNKDLETTAYALPYEMIDDHALVWVVD